MLKQLNLDTSEQGIGGCHVPRSPWDLPVLETLQLSTIRLCDTTDTSLDLFPKCLNLRDITLKQIFTLNLDAFIVRAPKLLKLIARHFKVASKVFKVVTPQFEKFCIGSWGFGSLQLSMEGLSSLHKVYLSMHYKKWSL